MNSSPLPNEPEVSSLEVGELYARYKSYAFAVAYRMLGSVVEAEDIVQDCFTGLQSQPSAVIHNPKSYIAKLVVNRSLNVLNSARNQRESYIGEWLPEPLSDLGTGLEMAVEQKEMISYAYLVMLECLSPIERAVFVLREAFQYDYQTIADWLGKSESNCRQIFSRAKRNLPQDRSSLARAQTTNKAQEQMLARFTAAFLNYDVQAMMEMLAEEPVFTADGGGRVHTVMRSMKVYKGVLALLTSRRVLTRLRSRQWFPTRINGELQLALLDDGQITEVLCLELDSSGERIRGVYLMVNPDKLRSIVVKGHEI
ncbi:MULTISPECIES: sigma-70 family RNA polymerase sigma factor [Paenibacillus]|uniref:sigma-70 family RNA polymerase sigma factor n=1 Tax=Paenibacillus TaxID=44249 RepID=UPI0011A04E0F|nr:sigma-70 family RNA polymerase sigma factor [Paenibacillus xylanexedens]